VQQEGQLISEDPVLDDQPSTQQPSRVLSVDWDARRALWALRIRGNPQDDGGAGARPAPELDLTAKVDQHDRQWTALRRVP
jgi:hypothetical protein